MGEWMNGDALYDYVQMRRLPSAYIHLERRGVC